MNRQEALSILKKYVKSDTLIKHSLAVEGSMRYYSNKFGEDIERWSIAGILHDVDYELYPDQHPLKGEDILSEEKVDREIIDSILGHADYTNIKRETKMAKALYAVDELSSFIVACTLVRPSKSFDDLNLKSVKKKLKDKAFAKAVNRDTIKKGADELGIDLDVHIQNVIDALAQREKELKQEGLSLVL
ncbi:HD domain-containing protein [Alkalithermobacter paradoxus]|uniref:tRNA 2'-O-methylase n=1 Tax=Alkalithermobacter paradoxus TaxID=29349 RepID=A0A1V4I3Z8_9FIRM|nr:tRNA 2'-O-methylase [[Clostridium] thermoalcaliphilum]